MRDVDDILSEICDKKASLQQAEKERVDKLNSPLNPGLRDEIDRACARFIAKTREEIEALVAELVRWPPHKIEHAAKLKQFFALHSYEKSVFIMTKYPEGDEPLDLQLKNVIKEVRDAVAACGYTSHLASDKKYHPELFRNIELYLLACSKAVAIVESKHTQELNPNVTMEWGWLRATERPVLFLVEEDFDKRRADIGGLIQDEFDWNAPADGIKAAVKSFLSP